MQCRWSSASVSQPPKPLKFTFWLWWFNKERTLELLVVCIKIYGEKEGVDVYLVEVNKILCCFLCHSCQSILIYNSICFLVLQYNSCLVRPAYNEFVLDLNFRLSVSCFDVVSIWNDSDMYFKVATPLTNTSPLTSKLDKKCQEEIRIKTQPLSSYQL